MLEPLDGRVAVLMHEQDILDDTSVTLASLMDMANVFAQLSFTVLWRESWEYHKGESVMVRCDMAATVHYKPVNLTKGQKGRILKICRDPGDYPLRVPQALRSWTPGYNFSAAASGEKGEALVHFPRIGNLWVPKCELSSLTM
jgi:hypothetical protein